MSENRKKPTYSVILTTYNRDKLLSRAIRSVLEQTYTDFELIIIDDASTDCTQECVRSFNDPRIKYIRLKTNGGVSTARNTGIENTSGEYISFLDDDDSYLPDFLLITNAKRESTSVILDYIWTGARRVGHTPDGKIVIKEETYTLDFSTEERKARSMEKASLIGMGSGVTIRSECLTKIGLFDETLKVAEDTDLIIRLLMHGVTYATIPEVLITIHDHNEGKLTDASNHYLYAKTYENFIKKYSDFFNNHSNLWARFNYIAADHYYYSGDKSSARKIRLMTMKRDPIQGNFVNIMCFRFFGIQSSDLIRKFLPEKFASGLISFVKQIIKK